jgi:hypothetical protein
MPVEHPLPKMPEITNGSVNKRKDEQMGLHQTKKLLHSKRKVTRLKGLFTEWEKIFASYKSG